ncbi:MAG: hypothetical protein M3P93_09810 [Actinomycetota bacterium]|nr:hypothetical protein [Actinomycetota bacterium]
MQRKNTNRFLAVATAATAGVAAWSGLAQATAPGAAGIGRTEESNVRVEDPIRVKANQGAQVIVAHITVQPGGHTPGTTTPGRTWCR